MIKQNKLLPGLQKRLIDLLSESAEIFVQAHPSLLQLEVNTWEVMYNEPYKFKTPAQIESWQKQNQLEIDRVIKAIEEQTTISETKDFFKALQTSFLDDQTPEEKQMWDQELIRKQLEEEYFALMQMLDK